MIRSVLCVMVSQVKGLIILNDRFDIRSLRWGLFFVLVFRTLFSSSCSFVFFRFAEIIDNMEFQGSVIFPSQILFGFGKSVLACREEWGKKNSNRLFCLFFRNLGCQSCPFVRSIMATAGSGEFFVIFLLTSFLFLLESNQSQINLELSFLSLFFSTHGFVCDLSVLRKCNSDSQWKHDNSEICEFWFFIFFPLFSFGKCTT